MVRALLLCALCLTTLACARTRAPADDDVDGLSRYLFEHWENPSRVADAMTNLAIWLEDSGRGDQAQSDGFVLDALTAEEIGELEYPTDRVGIEELVGGLVAAPSAWSIDHHAALLPMEDQTWNAPRNYERYLRLVTEGSEATFLAPTAAPQFELIRTSNDVIQSRSFGPFTFTIPYELRKDYRWTKTADGQRAIIGRTWAPRQGCTGSDSDDGGYCLELSFSIDLFYESAQGDTMRMTASWNYMKLPLTSNQQLGVLINGMLKVFDDTDAFLEQLHPDGP